jgi:methyl-accepting chemotaxis protein
MCEVHHCSPCHPRSSCTPRPLGQARYTDFIPPPPKKQRAASALAVEKAPRQPQLSLRIFNEKMEALSSTVRVIERNEDLRNKVMSDMTKQIEVNVKLIHSLKREKDQLKEEVNELKEEIKKLAKKGQP